MAARYQVNIPSELEHEYPFMKFISGEVIIQKKINEDTVEVLDMDDGIEFHIDKKYLSLK
ncbi:hypothetical protein COJ01_18070 [Priestia megaterium]|uniref:hypothetical protein n=1 Tax=Priestia megaterium TaxID=1404 RepID=UPI000BF30AD2|nr:hypothetical protein [Priestia megaterium]PFK99951.1 hypothetical protein COJ01_18070 [Priestia megaterium]